MGDDLNLHVATTDILNTRPLGCIEISVLNFQHQLITKFRTNAKGMGEVKISAIPFLIIAKRNNDETFALKNLYFSLVNAFLSIK